MTGRPQRLWFPNSVYGRVRASRTAAFWQALVLALLLAGLSLGCGHKKVARCPTPPPPEPPSATSPPVATENSGPENNSSAGLSIPAHAKPLYVETGVASWYAAPYHNRRGANGEIYNMYALTAAHRTLPLNSVARVTNLNTGRSAVVRITDRGPFIEGRMLDLSLAAAKQVDVWRPGTAKVKLEVFEAPADIDHGGRWCVQMGAFTDKAEARKFKEKLQRRYATADVLQFTGPTGEWIRVRVLEDDKERAESLLRETTAPEGGVFLVRLD